MSALNAASIAQVLDKKTPFLVPVGLTFREPHSWFSDVFVEFSEPIQLPLLTDKNHGNKLHSGDWVEPDEETTINVRNQLRWRTY